MLLHLNRTIAFKHVCTHTHVLACDTYPAAASLQVNNRCERILPSEHGWRGVERTPFEPISPPAADKAVVLDVNHCHLLCWRKFIQRWEPLYLARTMRDFAKKVWRRCVCSGIRELSLFLEISIWQVWLIIAATGEHMHGSRRLVEWVAHVTSKHF